MQQYQTSFAEISEFVWSLYTTMLKKTHYNVHHMSLSGTDRL